MELRVGTSGFSYKEWKGGFYPASLPANQMLNYYGQHFQSVEINYTFRSMPTVSLLENWAASVPDDFYFVLKAPQRITHIQRLRNTEEVLTEFFDVAESLTKSLGPVLFQLPPNFKKDTQRLKEFLELLPPEHRCAFEFRHQSWFDEDTFTLLRDHQVAMCLAEAENDLNVPFVSTADWGYVRLRRADYNDSELQTWLKQIRSQNWRDAFVFFKHEDEGKGPRMGTRLLEIAR
jgi:uncharacterized protein YecE (DUF72 family)